MEYNLEHQPDVCDAGEEERGERKAHVGRRKDEG